MMKKLLFLSFVIALVGVVSCKDSDKEKEDENIKMFMDELKADSIAAAHGPDSVLLKALREDKTTIKSTDIDMKDSTFSARSKFIYVNAANPNERMAVVLGLKTDGAMGVALVQMDDGKEITYKLPQTKRINAAEGEFSDGKVTFKNSVGGKATLIINGATKEFIEAK